MLLSLADPISNGFIALRCAFETANSQTFDPIVKELVSAIITRGLITTRLIVFAACGALLPVIAGLAALFVWRPTSTATKVSVLCAAGLVTIGAVLLRGTVLERRLTTLLTRSRSSTVKFSEAQARNVEHVMCCTDVPASRAVQMTPERLVSLTDGKAAG